MDKTEKKLAAYLDRVDLIERFNDLIRPRSMVLLSHDKMTNVAVSILNEYDQSHRHYHGVPHLQTCLKTLDLLKKNYAHDAPKTIEALFFAIELALWYHDVVYDPQRKDNEKHSAFRAKKDLEDLCIPAPMIKRVRGLIMATCHSKPENVSFEEACIRDIDLAILGTGKREYARYEKGIRKEYSFVSDKDFKEGRLRILRMFYGRNPLYLTDFYSRLYGTRAKENLARAIIASASHF